MLTSLMILIAVTGISYVGLTFVQERQTARDRLVLAVKNSRQHTKSSLNKEKMLASIEGQQKRKTKTGKNLSALLAKAGLTYTTQQAYGVIGATALVAASLVYISLGNLFVALVVCAFIIVVIPRLALGYMIAEREAKFLNELPNALDIMSRGLRAGMPLGTCIKQISETTAEPLRSEFAQIVDLQKLGVPLPEAIQKMPDRIDLMDLRYFTIVIEIQQKSGGNLAEILGNISEVIRGRRELRSKIRALIAEAKTSSIIIGIMPVGFAFMSYYSDPETFSRFWTLPMGQVLSLVCFLFYAVGIMIFIKLANVRA